MSSTQNEIMHRSGFVTAAEAAEALLKSSVSTVHRMASAGKLEFQRPCGNWYISAKSILAQVRGTPLEENAVAVLKRVGAFPSTEVTSCG